MGERDLIGEIDALTARVEALETLVRANPRTSYMNDVIRWRLKADLPKLMELHPNGVESSHIAEYYGCSLATTIQTMVEMGKRGKIQWIKRPGTKFKIALPLGAPLPPLGLTAPQQRIMDAILKRGQGEEVAISGRSLSLEVGGSPSAVVYVVACLLRSGQLKLVERGAAGRPSRYRVMTMSPQQRALADATPVAA